ncbi:hypothetical protein NEF87_004398 [Candidatus Lokiarchaeum ossiferum]|uniref:Tetratricopeptide repeat protein n=1 Tax=Candidatus Lokiarchaeum ossiferum TaxID=2951803 RepID=A0ABY6HX55_9ARCH|nr:hypothetical protein NEF87_004398 [Candidatus Lokiarchaeum sp. B-35]
MPVDEVLLNLAFELTEEGEGYAHQGNYSEAILKLQQALDLFQKANLPDTEKSKVMNMMDIRQKEYERLERETRESGIESPPQTTSIDNLVEEGLQLLNEAEFLLNQENYSAAIEIFHKSVEKLTRAGWSSEQLKSIHVIINNISKLLDQESSSPSLSMNQESPAESSNFSPTFLKTQQSDFIDKKIKVTPQNSGEEQYVPSFLKLQNVQKDIRTHQSSEREINKKIEDEYSPSFLKTNQPNYSLPSKPIVDADEDQNYIPSYSLSNQTDVIDEPGKKTALGASVIDASQHNDEDYIPSFAKNIEKGQDFDSTEIAHLLKQASGEVLNSIPPSEHKSSVSVSVEDQDNMASELPENEILSGGEIPSFKIIDLRNQVEMRSQSLLDQFEEILADHEKKLDEIFISINQIRKLEEQNKFNLAIAQLNICIDKLKKIPGWTDQATTLIAWLLILREKNRLITQSNKVQDLDLTRINAEFTRIMQGSLKSSSQVTISFDSLLNQELSGEQLFQTKLNQQKLFQDAIFELFDQGHLHILGEKYKKAIQIWNDALIKINSLQWKEFANQNRKFLSHLARLSDLYDLSLLSDSQKEKTSSFSRENYEAENKKKTQARLLRLNLLEKQSNEYDKVQSEAFSQIDQAEICLQRNEFEDAIHLYEDAIHKLVEIGWESQISALNTRLSVIRSKKEQFLTNLQSKYYEELKRKESERQVQDEIQQAITRKQEKMHTEKIQRENFKTENQILLEIQTSIRSKIEEVGNYLDVHQFQEASETLDSVLTLINTHGLNDQRATIEQLKKTIVQKEQNYRLEIQSQKLHEKQMLQEKLEFERYLEAQSKEIALQRDQKQKKLADFHQKKMDQRKLEQQAFQLMDDAEKFLNINEFTQAIDYYKQANLIFKSIGWNIDEKSHLERVYRIQAEYVKTVDQAEKERLRQVEQKHQVELQEKQRKQTKQSALNDIHALLGSIGQKSSTPIPADEKKLKGEDKMGEEMKLILSATSKQMKETLKERNAVIDRTVRTIGSEINTAATTREELQRIEEQKKAALLAAAQKKKEDEEKLKAKQEIDAFKRMIQAAVKKKNQT